MNELPLKFGRYLLLDKLAEGGMAEIYRACPATLEGFERILVIKRILKSDDDSAQHIQMFKQEIKTTMGFNHPCIAQVHDFGEEDGQHYIVMEMVDGRNLRQLISQHRLSGTPFPLAPALHIIAQAASGLHYAHTFKDKISGAHLKIVHRDVSPSNILVSFDGGVKLIDFGIAKNKRYSENTAPGTVKGKPSYLSPEQIKGEPVDGRADVFALGAVLWELLVGQRLFAGDSDIATIAGILDDQSPIPPPSSFRPDIPKEVDYAVLRALARSPQKRYPRAEEFHQDLKRLLHEQDPNYSDSELSIFVSELFSAALEDERKNLQALSVKAEQFLRSTSSPTRVIHTGELKLTPPSSSSAPRPLPAAPMATPVVVGSGEPPENSPGFFGRYWIWILLTFAGIGYAARPLIQSSPELQTAPDRSLPVPLPTEPAASPSPTPSAPSAVPSVLPSSRPVTHAPSGPCSASLLIGRWKNAEKNLVLDFDVSCYFRSSHCKVIGIAPNVRSYFGQLVLGSVRTTDPRCTMRPEDNCSYSLGEDTLTWHCGGDAPVRLQREKSL